MYVSMDFEKDRAEFMVSKVAEARKQYGSAYLNGTVEKAAQAPAQVDQR